ncbi:MAG: TIGR04255 family protein [Nitrosospira sp.]|nr:TIGR04255 family protein [Nitrosospira sp.]MDN5882847.1 TIGR04255 family protein [Nitrosospira sp.]MDN5936345.1 TIGR04255 family protein [Nitrosospira sp.]
MGEKMKNAPVYFTIAQVRHNPVLQLGYYAPDIQERMRKAGYPDFKKGTAMAFSFSLRPHIDNGSMQQNPAVEPVERLMFFSADSTRGFVVEQNALSFHTTDYDTFETFADEFMRGVSIVHECVTLALTVRIGLRYLDAVVPPNEEEGLPSYLAPGVLGISNRLPADVLVSHSIAETHIQTSECAVLARTIIQAGQLGFPMDLQPIGVKIADHFQKIDGVHAIIDTDASIERQQAFDMGSIREQLEKLRRGVGLAFDATVMPLAVVAWNN